MESIGNIHPVNFVFYPQDFVLSLPVLLIGFLCTLGIIFGAPVPTPAPEKSLKSELFEII